MEAVRVIGTLPLQASWTDRLTTEPSDQWSKLETLLRSDPSWEQETVDSVATESFRVLRHLPDPMQQKPFQGRGLVVGYVQSGKTANYTAVAARAVDAGYRLVIVLSGIHDSLRKQTQQRLERELTGDSGPINQTARTWTLLTTATEDFQDQDIQLLRRKTPFLAVVKKNVAVLQKLDRWLEAGGDYLEELPVLIIDDEADQASINTKGNRPLDPAISDVEEPDESVAPSRTNELIRLLLSRMKKAAYIAYTATPFANVLISPEVVDRHVGHDLFPKDFVLQLPRPKGYTGTEELFGVSAQGRNVLRTVPPEDVPALRGSRRRRKAEIILELAKEALPDSLTDALVSFCLAGAIRTLRGFRGKSHTMLVHVSQRTLDQGRIAGSIREQLDLWREAHRQGQDLKVVFAPIWADMKPGIKAPQSDTSILDAAIKVLQELVVLELNSVTGENLEYEEKPSRHIVAVGGNRLSRGLTLEGLTISYFLRTTSMCDTLLQMARWYGFRTGYEDLIQIWTTDGIARWFSELALVEQSLRDSIIALSRAGRRPEQMAIHLRAHSDLLLTARNKSETAEKVQDSWSGEHPQTVLLPLTEPAKLRANLALTDGFVKNLSPKASQGGLLARDIRPEAISAFLRDYQIHDDIVVFRNELLADWIMSRVAVNELTDWSVFVASPSNAHRNISLGGKQVGLVRRKRISSDSIGILTDPAHEGVDLSSGPDAYRRDSGDYDSEAMRAARPPTQGLLIIYPLDPEHLDVPNIEAVIGLTLSLPHTSDARASWIINSAVSDD